MLVCHQYDVCKNYVGRVYVGGYGGLSESGLSVSRKLCSFSFLVVGEIPSVVVFDVVWCLPLWLMCLVLCGPSF